MENENDWEVEIYVVEDTDGTVLAHSQETDAYEIYGQDPDLAYRVGQAQGIVSDDTSPEELATHFERTAATRRELEEFITGKSEK